MQTEYFQHFADDLAIISRFSIPVQIVTGLPNPGKLNARQSDLRIVSWHLPTPGLGYCLKGRNTLASLVCCS